MPSDTTCTRPAPAAAAVIKSLGSAEPVVAPHAAQAAHAPSAQRAHGVRRRIPLARAAGHVGAAITLSAAGIEVARAWVVPTLPLSEASSALGGAVVALFVLAGLGFATRARELGGVAVASSFGLLAYGVTLVVEAQSVGAIFVGLAPIVGMLAHASFQEPPAAPDPASGASIAIAWAIAKSRAKVRQKTARAAERAASRSLHGMLA